MDSNLVCQDIGIDDVNHFLIGPRQIGTSPLDKPLLSCYPGNAFPVNALLSCTQTDGLVGSDDGCTDRFFNHNLFAGDVCACTWDQTNKMHVPVKSSEQTQYMFLKMVEEVQQSQEQHYPFLSACVVFFVCPNNGMTASVWDFLSAHRC